MSVYEDVGLSQEDADKLWDRDFVLELYDFENPGTILNTIINDDRLSIKEKVYLTWIYTYTLETRMALRKNNDNAW